MWLVALEGVRWGWAGALGIAATAACNVSGVFVCTTDAQCTNGGSAGQCQADGYCSFADSDCPSGQRYGSVAAADLAKTCVEVTAGASSSGSDSQDDATASSSVTATDPSAGSTTAGTTLNITTETTGATESSSSTTDDASGSSSSSGVTLDPDLVAWYRLDGPFAGCALDSSGNGHMATCSACPAPIEGVYETAVSADGEGQFLVVPNAPEFAIESWTLSAWIWAEVEPTSFWTVVGKPVGILNDNSFEIGISPDGLGTSVGAGWSDGTISQGVGGTLRAIGEWVHVAATLSPETATMYVDGEIVDQEPLTVVPGFDDSDIYIGADIDMELLDNFFYGRIDDVRIYRRALSQEEVLAVMSGANLAG